MWKPDTRKQGLLDNLFGGGGGGGAATGGFFGSGGKTTNSQSYSETNTTQTTLSEIEGVGVVGSDNQILFSDQGAIAAGEAIAREALDASRTLYSRSLDSQDATVSEAFGAVGDAVREIGRSQDLAYGFGEAAFGTVDRALASVSGAYRDAATVQQDALDTVSQESERTTSLIATLAGDFVEGLAKFAKDATTTTQETIGETVTALNAIAVEQNKSTDQRVAEISANATKYVVIGVGILAAAAAAIAIFRGGR